MAELEFHVKYFLAPFTARFFFICLATVMQSCILPVSGAIQPRQKQGRSMNAKTLEAIRRHGEALLAAFPHATEKDPVALCKKLRRVETSLASPILSYCNDSGFDGQTLELACIKARSRVKVLLGLNDSTKVGLFINRDPRGYALKLCDEWTRDFNNDQYKARKPAIHTDMGGYGILAPDLTN